MIALLRARVALRLALVVCAGGCAGGGALRVSDVTPQSIPALETQRAQHPRDAGTLSRLGVAYLRANRLAEARGMLDSAVVIDPSSGLAAIYLGMTTEGLGDFAAARTAYQRYIAVSRSSELRGAARQRLALIGRRELEYQARQALAQESVLVGTPPEANTIAVMPFGYTGTNEDVRPLTRGMAQLIITDLAKSRQVRVLERERLQAVLAEMHLGEQGRVDSTTALRSGRLLRAERLVQGNLTERGSELRVDAAVVEVSTSGVQAQAGAQDELNRLFELEKQVVLTIFNNLGIQLTDAEREAINQRPTQNVQAFLAYSRGLEAEDRGDFNAAREAFSQAATLDPGFSAAAQSASAAADIGAAAAQSMSQVDAVVTQNERQESGGAGVSEDAKKDALSSALNNVAPSQTSQQQSEQQQSTPPSQRDPTAEGTRTEGTKPPTGTVIIVIRRPP